MRLTDCEHIVEKKNEFFYCFDAINGVEIRKVSNQYQFRSFLQKRNRKIIRLRVFNNETAYKKSRAFLAYVEARTFIIYESEFKVSDDCLLFVSFELPPDVSYDCLDVRELRLQKHTEVFYIDCVLKDEPIRLKRRCRNENN